jgi:hypothetical protein
MLFIVYEKIGMFIGIQAMFSGQNIIDASQMIETCRLRQARSFDKVHTNFNGSTCFTSSQTKNR